MATAEATPGGPSMTVTPSHGAVGTVVSVSVVNCPKPTGGYAGFFADAHAMAAPANPSLRRALALVSTASGVVTAHYSISAKDAAGYGLFEVQCGSNSNATASFTVGS
jgi:hypothetical protein